MTEPLATPFRSLNIPPPTPLNSRKLSKEAANPIGGGPEDGLILLDDIND